MIVSSYRPGDWFGVFGSATTLVLPGSERDRVAALWSRIDDGAGFDETLDALLQSGLGSLSGFVLIGAGEGPVRILARGPVLITGTADGEPVRVDGREACTWVERSLHAVESLTVEVGAAGEAGEAGEVIDGDQDHQDEQVGDLPILEGLVRVSRVDRPAVTAGRRSGPPAPSPGALEPEDVAEPSAHAAAIVVAHPEPATEAMEAGEAPEAPEAPEVLEATEPIEEPSPLDEESDTYDVAHPSGGAELLLPLTGPPLEPPAAPPVGTAPTAPPGPPPSPPSPLSPPSPAAAPASAPEDLSSPRAEIPGDEATFVPPSTPQWSAAPSLQPRGESGSDDDADHDGMTHVGAVGHEFARQLPGIPGQPAAPRVTAPVARLLFSSGEDVEVDRVILIGRAPEARRFTSTDQPRLVSVPSPLYEISSTHLEIRPGSGADHGSAVVTDMGSTNGTVLDQPGLGPEGLKAGIAVQLIPGATINLGDGVTIQVTRP